VIAYQISFKFCVSLILFSCLLYISILNCTILMFKGKALVGLLVLRERSKDLLVLREGFTTNLLFLRGRLLSPFSVQVCINLRIFLILRERSVNCGSFSFKGGTADPYFKDKEYCSAVLYF